MSPFPMSNRAYDVAKWFVQIILPAIGAFYFGLSEIWDFPDPTRVVGTIALLTTFLGIVLGISSASYNSGASGLYDGRMVVTPKADGRTLYSLEVDHPLEDLQELKDVRLSVVRQFPEDHILDE